MTTYIAARDLAGLPFGTHQFIVVVITERENFPLPRLNRKTISPKYLGPGKIGYVIGAQNRGNLQVEFFEKNDYLATKEFFDKSLVSWYKSDFDTEMIEVVFSEKNEAGALRKLYDLVDNYNINQSYDAINYPKAGLGYNSNSWAQTALELAGGIKPSNLKGLDISHEKRIPKTFFEPICPVKPRPKINQ
tara:strand:- start:3158 stop:3727 length:570 start_codon:yes stop_codon:yes gene_type:complete